MRNARKLLLLAVMAVAAMAVSAPAAFGQLQENHETLEATIGGVHCPALPTGCLIHAKSQGEVELRKHVFGIESHITSCENEFHGRLNEDAEGFITHQVLSGHPTGTVCPRQPCDADGVAPPDAWPAHGDENMITDPPRGETVPYKETLIVTFCVKPSGGGANESCETDVPFNQVGATTTYEFGDAATELPGHGFSGFRCELVGHWITEDGGSIEGRSEQKPLINHVLAENKAEVP